MSQDLVRARRGVSNGPDSRLQQAEAAVKKLMAGPRSDEIALLRGEP